MKKLALFFTFIISFVMLLGMVCADDIQGSYTEGSFDWYIFEYEEDSTNKNSFAKAEQFLVSLTNKEFDDGNSIIIDFGTNRFSLYGCLKNNNARAVFTVFNGQEYELVRFLEESKGIPFSNNGLFHKDIELSQGENKFKLVAYLDEAVENPVPGENLQITCFTVNTLSGHKAQNKVNDRGVSDILQQINKSLIGE